MGYPRHTNVSPDTPGVYLCTSRCVRRAFLCGEDEQTGRSYEHRKSWMEERILALGEVFAVAIHAYTVMSNHFHIVIATDPLAPLGWTDEEVAKRWISLTGLKVSDVSCSGRIQALIGQPERLKLLRERLGSLSWYMRCLKEPIARRANKEDACTGRFWEGRFDAKVLLDATAVLSSMVYVDLNPVRAGVCKTPEDSLHTSIRRRIESFDKKQQTLLPLANSIGSNLVHATFEEYLTLVDWSGRQLHTGKRGTIQGDLPNIVQRLNLRRNQWLIQIPATESNFWRAIGRLESLLSYANKSGHRWIRGIGTARRLAHLVDNS